MQKKIKHLEIIQGIIDRLARNSFLLKGWSVVLVSALFAFGATGSNKSLVAIAYLPALAFWGLDGYFLRQERLFRALYDKIRELKEDDIDFSMKRDGIKVDAWFYVLISKTLLFFHGPIIIVITVICIIL
ncbi:MAG: hypothetical protein V3T30_04085 [Thermodesulfobacteriota bacterium]